MGIKKTSIAANNAVGGGPASCLSYFQRHRSAKPERCRWNGIKVGTREGTLPLPPNRTGGSPASGFPVSGFVVLRWSASTGGLLPRTAAHRAQTIHGASGGAPPPTPAGFGLAAFPAGSPIVASRSHPRSQTHSPGCAGSIHTSRATPGSLPSRWPRSSARRSAHPLSQLLQALRPRPFPAALEVIPEGKSKPPWRARIHHARLAGDAGSAPLRRYYGRSDSRRAALRACAMNTA